MDSLKKAKKEGKLANFLPLTASYRNINNRFFDGFAFKRSQNLKPSLHINHFLTNSISSSSQIFFLQNRFKSARDELVILKILINLNFTTKQLVLMKKLVHQILHIKLHQLTCEDFEAYLRGQLSVQNCERKKNDKKRAERYVNGRRRDGFR